MMRLLFFWFLLWGLSSCGLISQVVVAAVAQSQERSARLAKFDDLVDHEQYREALAVIREEIRAPEYPSDKHLGRIYCAGISALRLYVDQNGPQQGFDEEALSYLREGQRHAQKDKRRAALLLQSITLYYSYSNRNGISLTYAHQELESWKQLDDKFHIILSLSNLATIYDSMGVPTVRDYYRLAALDLGREYYRLPSHPSDLVEWTSYLNTVISRRMNDLASKKGAKTAEEILALWATEEPILRQFFSSNQYQGYLNVAEALSDAGVHDHAWKFYLQAEAKARQSGSSQDSEQRIICTKTKLLADRGEYRPAFSLMRRCLDLIKETRKETSLATGAAMLEGQVLEGVGKFSEAASAYQRAIALYEQVRGSFALSQRGAFFHTSREAYLGLIRSWAKDAVLHGQSEERILAVLRASELLRARQFGDILAASGKRFVQVETLGQIRAHLSRQEALLYYVLLDAEIVLVAITNEQTTVNVIPVSVSTLSQQLQMVARGLSTPSSAEEAIERNLASLGQQLLASVRPLIQGKLKWYVLPDGVLNTIPFDLLSMDGVPYRAILEDHLVQLTPSLAYFLAADTGSSTGSRGGLFAVADPAYAAAPKIGQLSSAEIQAASRGSNYLRYFKRLPETRREVARIAQFFEGQPMAMLVSTEARESRLKRTDLTQYSFIHIATHGILGGELPGLSEPALVLAEEPGEDGFLTASEAAALHTQASLTVLSACNTGTGPYVTGEGVLGMGRAFLLAGSRSVVVSLWSVDSLATERLMVQFYQNLRDGREPASALREAKLTVRGGVRLDAADPAVRGLFVDKGQDTPNTPPGTNSDASPQASEANTATQPKRHPFFFGAFVLFGR